ncbi:Reticulon-4-interacting protein 1 -like protein, mitochondrial [Aspergillus udagawae]|nr:Reticulon-4-interacting protein 1 -like protein, mitochondrial [Aspergillus udagawae]
MYSINISKYTTPEYYELSELPAPTFEGPKDIVIKVHAACINPIDVKKASGVTKAVLTDDFPYKIGYDCAGTVAEIGPQVTRFKVGDEVFARLPEFHRARTTGDFVALKLTSLSMEDSASSPLAAVTALQAFRRYPGSLEGKTVFVPAGLSGTGLFACQLAKNVFKAGKVISTVSTSKITIIDYTKTDPKTVIPPQSVDFLFDTTGDSMTYLSLMRPTSVIVSIAILTSGDVLQNSSIMRLSPESNDRATVPFPIRIALNVLDRIRTIRASRRGVKYSAIFLEPNAKDLDSIREWVDSGKLRTVVGTKVPYKDLEAVRKACQVVFGSKGGVGKSVITFA